MAIKNHKRVRRAIRVATYAELALDLGPKQTEIVVGKTYDLHPACDLWMRGAKTARVKAIYQDAIGRVDLVRGTFRVGIDRFA